MNNLFNSTSVTEFQFVIVRSSNSNGDGDDEENNSSTSRGIGFEELFSNHNFEMGINDLDHHEDLSDDEEHEYLGQVVMKRMLKQAIADVDNAFSIQVYENLALLMDDDEKVLNFDQKYLTRQDVIEIAKRNNLIKKYVHGATNVVDIQELAKLLSDQDDFTLQVDLNAHNSSLFGGNGRVARRIYEISKSKILIQAIKMKPDWHLLYMDYSNHLYNLKRYQQLVKVNGNQWTPIELLLLSITLKPTTKAYIDLLQLLNKTEQDHVIVNYKKQSKLQLISKALEIGEPVPIVYYYIGLYFDSFQDQEITIGTEKHSILGTLSLALEKCKDHPQQHYIYYGIYKALIKINSNVTDRSTLSIKFGSTNRTVNFKTILIKSISKGCIWRKTIYKELVKLLNSNSESVLLAGKSISKSQMLKYIEQH